MSDNCLYCNKVLTHQGFSVCKECGEKIWGEKMYSTIRNNMANSDPIEDNLE